MNLCTLHLPKPWETFHRKTWLTLKRHKLFVRSFILRIHPQQTLETMWYRVHHRNSLSGKLLHNYNLLELIITSLSYLTRTKIHQEEISWRVRIYEQNLRTIFFLLEEQDVIKTRTRHLLQLISNRKTNR